MTLSPGVTMTCKVPVQLRYSYILVQGILPPESQSDVGCPGAAGRFGDFGSGCRPCQLKVAAWAYAIVIKPRQVRIANSAMLQEESRIARMTDVGTN